jgi:hypothetical protein
MAKEYAHVKARKGVDEVLGYIASVLADGGDIARWTHVPTYIFLEQPHTARLETSSQAKTSSINRSLGGFILSFTGTFGVRMTSRAEQRLRRDTGRFIATLRMTLQRAISKEQQQGDRQNRIECRSKAEIGPNIYTLCII